MEFQRLVQSGEAEQRATALDILDSFLKAAQEDPHIATAHISLFTALWKLWRENEQQEPHFSFYSVQLMTACKISSPSTFHKVIKELNEYGYIHYTPSFNRYVGSKVRFTKRQINKYGSHKTGHARGIT